MPRQRKFLESKPDAESCLEFHRSKAVGNILIKSTGNIYIRPQGEFIVVYPLIASTHSDNKGVELSFQGQIVFPDFSKGTCALFYEWTDIKT